MSFNDPIYTNGTITILKSDVDRFLNLFDPNQFDQLELDTFTPGFPTKSTVSFPFSDYPDGYINHQEHEVLLSEGIPYKWDWEGSGHLRPGCICLRFSKEGKEIINVIDMESTRVSVRYLKDIFETKGADFVEQYLSEQLQKITPLPWDNQQKFANIYRTKKLVGLRDLSSVSS